MPCYHPVHGFQNRKGDPLVFSRAQCTSSTATAVDVPCNSCVGCRLEHARQWAMRCVDEASLFDANSFITLTVDSDHIVKHGRSVSVPVFQRFMKRFRKEISPSRVRFMAALEYGSKFGRPHYHALIFNYGFVDKVYLKNTSSGEKIYRSAQLERLWDYGFSSVGDVTFGSAAYVARYHLKKVGGVVSKDHYLDKRTGEMLSPERIVMSRGSGRNDPDPRFRFGIGAHWFDKFKSDVYPHDSRVIKGVDTKPCKFYDSRYGLLEPEALAKVKLRRVFDSVRRRCDNTEERLLVREKVKLAQIASLSSSVEDDR